MNNILSMMEAERQKLMDARAKLLEERAALDAKIAGIDVELSAMSAYEQARAPSRRRRVAAAPRAVAASTAPAQERRGGLREDVLALLTGAPAGLKRADILTAMQAKGDRRQEIAVSNALAALKKADSIRLEDGVYAAGATPAAPEAPIEKPAKAARKPAAKKTEAARVAAAKIVRAPRGRKTEPMVGA